MSMYIYMLTSPDWLIPNQHVWHCKCSFIKPYLMHHTTCKWTTGGHMFRQRSSTTNKYSWRAIHGPISLMVMAPSLFASSVLFWCFYDTWYFAHQISWMQIMPATPVDIERILNLTVWRRHDTSTIGYLGCNLVSKWVIVMLDSSCLYEISLATQGYIYIYTRYNYTHQYSCTWIYIIYVICNCFNIYIYIYTHGFSPGDIPSGMHRCVGPTVQVPRCSTPWRSFSKKRWRHGDLMGWNSEAMVTGDTLW